MKHTKGKWGVKQTGFKKTVVCGNMIIASDLYDENKSPSIDEVDANANLIASAPDMLKTLEWVRDWMYDHTTQNDTIKKVCDMIDKAEGN